MTLYKPQLPEPKKYREGYRLSISYNTPYESATFEIDTKKHLSKRQMKQWVDKITAILPEEAP